MKDPERSPLALPSPDPRRDDAPPEPGPAQEVWTVDGLEPTPRGMVARLERPDGTLRDVPLSELPAGVAEGDLLGVQEKGDGLTAWRLPERTAARRREAQASLDALNAAGEGRSGDGDEEITL